MSDERKFRLLVWLASFLTVMVISYNLFQEYLLPGLEDYLQRRADRQYYERVISGKGFSLHKGMYWKEKKE